MLERNFELQEFVLQEDPLYLKVLEVLGCPRSASECLGVPRSFSEELSGTLGHESPEPFLRGYDASKSTATT